MLEFWRSLFKQSNPSTLTAADLIPNFTQPQHPPLTRDGDGINGESEGETRFSLMFCVGEIRGKMEVMKLHQIMFLPLRSYDENAAIRVSGKTRNRVAVINTEGEQTSDSP